MAYTVFSASAAPSSLYSDDLRRTAKTAVEALDFVGPPPTGPPMETGPPTTERVPAVTPDEGVGGMAYDSYLKMLAAQREFAETDKMVAADNTLLIGGDAVRKMI